MVLIGESSWLTEVVVKASSQQATCSGDCGKTLILRYWSFQQLKTVQTLLACSAMIYLETGLWSKISSLATLRGSLRSLLMFLDLNPIKALPFVLVAYSGKSRGLGQI
jgi:hypothetical protein